MGILLFYYTMVFIFVGVIGSLFAVNELDILPENFLKIIFMYQYAVYQIAKDDINIIGIIILEILTTFSVWFLNVIIVIAICLWYVLSAICNVFYFVFKKR